MISRNAYLEKGRLVVGINSGGGWYTKRWGRAQFAELAERLVGELGARIVLLWGPGQRPEAETMQSMINIPRFLLLRLPCRNSGRCSGVAAS